LGISFHTAKFHVAAILTKLNADSRTEAVTRLRNLARNALNHEVHFFVLFLEPMSLWIY